MRAAVKRRKQEKEFVFRREDGKEITVRVKESPDFEIEAPYTYKFHKMILVEAPELFIKDYDRVERRFGAITKAIIEVYRANNYEENLIWLFKGDDLVGFINLSPSEFYYAFTLCKNVCVLKQNNMEDITDVDKLEKLLEKATKVIDLNSKEEHKKENSRWDMQVFEKFFTRGSWLKIEGDISLVDFLNVML